MCLGFSVYALLYRSCMCRCMHHYSQICLKIEAGTQPTLACTWPDYMKFYFGLSIVEAEDRTIGIGGNQLTKDTGESMTGTGPTLVRCRNYGGISMNRLKMLAVALALLAPLPLGGA